MNFASAAAIMDAAVDAKLGDDVAYASDGVSFQILKAFVIPAEPQDDFTAAPIDELGGRKRLKIRRDLMPEISPSHRIRSDLIGDGTWRPAAKRPDIRGRYFIFDLQKA